MESYLLRETGKPRSQKTADDQANSGYLELNAEVMHEGVKPVFLKSSQIQRRNYEGTATHHRSRIQTVQHPAGVPEQTDRGTTVGNFLRKDYFNHEMKTNKIITFKGHSNLIERA